MSAENELNGAHEAVFLTIGEIAERDQVSKPNVSQIVKRLVEQFDLRVERDSLGRVARVAIAEYDHLRTRYGDPAKAQAPKVAAAPVLPASDSLEEANRRRAWYEVDRRRLEVEEARGNLIRRDRLQAALIRCGEALVQPLDRLTQEADSLAEIHTREGDHGLRKALRSLARRLREDQAAALRALAAVASPLDGALGDEPESATHERAPERPEMGG